MRQQVVLLIYLFFCILNTQTDAQEISQVHCDQIPYKSYPELNEAKPDLPSPFRDKAMKEYVVAVNIDGLYAIMPVSLHDERGICSPQLYIDSVDFPSLFRTGIHDDRELLSLRSITSWSLDTITRLGRPGALSQAGFMAADENVLSVLRADNNIVKDLGLDHRHLAKPLFHVLNMMDEDLRINRWNMARHRWDHIKHFYYNRQMVMVEAYDTKGGQRSIFNDGIDGAFHIKLWREISQPELSFLKNKYSSLSEEQFDTMIEKLSFLNVGEMQPQYIMRYGFYEGHTFWRADPIAITFIFGLRSIEEIERSLNGRLFDYLVNHFVH